MKQAGGPRHFARGRRSDGARADSRRVGTGVRASLEGPGDSPGDASALADAKHHDGLAADAEQVLVFQILQNPAHHLS